jgi:hypothetical protein
MQWNLSDAQSNQLSRMLIGDQRIDFADCNDLGRSEKALYTFSLLAECNLFLILSLSSVSLASE